MVKKSSFISSSSLKNLLLWLVTFWVVGELLLRLDASWFRWNQGSTNLENLQRESALLDQVNAGSSPVINDDLRILVLGDSIIYGAGVPFDNTFSQLLQAKLLSSGHYPKGASVLNVSRPGNNMLRNRMDFDRYLEVFKPGVVVLGYNLNDVFGKQTFDSPISTSTNSAAAKESAGASISRVARIRKLLFSSRVIGWFVPLINLELKFRGIVLPGSEFDYLVHHSHRSGSPGWETCKAHLQHLIDTCARKNIRLLVYVVPELNMIDHYSLFDDAHKSLSAFLESSGLAPIQGSDPFVGKGLDYRTFALSRHDGHPNAKAHEMMAEQVFRKVIETQPSK